MMKQPESRQSSILETSPLKKSIITDSYPVISKTLPQFNVKISKHNEAIFGWIHKNAH
jgi:hypothetical protein